jgi:lipoate-protein ligase A
MGECWRVIDSGPGQAGWNMAVDEAVLVMAGRGESPPTLRFFSWDAPSLSIGSFQKAGELNLTLIKEKNVPIVRRPTGGRAVLHDAELTYSLACPIPSPYLPSGLMDSYKVIGSCFLAGLSLLGVSAQLLAVSKNPDRKSRPRDASHPLCFSSPSWYEVLSDGKKLIGSAQRRLKDSLLQQGSLLIKLDIDGLLSLMLIDDDDKIRARESLLSKMTALEDLGHDIPMERLKGALIDGFSAGMGAPFVMGGLTPDEERLALRLFEEKYSRPEWNLYREAMHV